MLSLCTEIRILIFRTKIFDEPHKLRLLNRVAAIEREIHQPKGRMDVILAGVVDVGDAAGKFGEKVKPLTDRFQEIVGVVWGKSKQYEQLPRPDDVKRLPPPK